MSVQGRDLLTGKPKQAMVSHREVARALDKSILRIEDAIMEALSQTPPELAADIYNTGIYLAGGGSYLRIRQAYLPQNRSTGLYRRRSTTSCCSRYRNRTEKHRPFRTILLK